MKNKGFTLLELLIVMAILGTLAGIVIVNYPASRQRARDTQRISDLKQYQIGYESYANNNNGVYFNNPGNPFDHCGDIFPVGTVCPEDPRDGQNECNGTCGYHYEVNLTGTQYVIWARLERPADTSKMIFAVCSNGNTGYTGSVPAGGTCPSLI